MERLLGARMRVAMVAMAMIAGVLLSALPAAGCQVPVFRYALEKWPPSPLDVAVFHRGALTAEQQRWVDGLKSTAVENGGPANFALRLVDVNSGIDEVDRALWKGLSAAQLPVVAVRYTEPEAESAAVWSGPLNGESIRQIAESPARRQVAERILQGESIVWVLVEGGDKARDDKLAGVLAAGLAKVGAELKLPEDSEKSAMPAGPELRIAFSMLRLSANDPAERVFAAMLRHVDGEKPADGEPVVVPIFGRGRALGVMREADFDGETVQMAAEFLCGECSCQVKDQCPGTDMLIAADWEAPFAGGKLSDALPALTGLAPFATAGVQPGATTMMAATPTLAAGMGGGHESNLWRNVGWAAGGLAAAGAGATFLVLRRRKGQA